MALHDSADEDPAVAARSPTAGVGRPVAMATVRQIAELLAERALARA